MMRNGPRNAPLEEETAMMIVAVTPLGSLLLLLVVPVGIVAGVYGSECVSVIRHRPRLRRSQHPR